VQIARSSEIRGPIVTRSALQASQEEVWARVTTVDGINDELAPWLRMTATRALRVNGIAEVRVGERICRSWVLLFGVLPIDYDDITLERLEPPRGFLERSAMLSQKAWEHERTIEGTANDASGCILTDRIRYEPRIPVPDALLRTLYAAIFRHRHRRLQRRFGGGALV
jgi:ligand-binding SRPBCC domain-containing protein